jgi:hypothetical protein
MDYTANIILIKKDTGKQFDSSCFGSGGYYIDSNLDGFIFEVHPSIKDVEKYLQFIDEIVNDPFYTYVVNCPTDQKVLFKLNEKYQDVLSKKRYCLMVFTLLRYIQEFPEIVYYMEENGYSWENFQKAHAHWNTLAQKNNVFYNGPNHSICFFAKLIEKFCSLEEFSKRQSGNNLEYVYSYFKP